MACAFLLKQTVYRPNITTHTPTVRLNIVKYDQNNNDDDDNDDNNNNNYNKQQLFS